MSEPGLHVELLPLPSLAELARDWRALEQRSQASFFLRWSWIGAWLQWLQGQPTQPRLLRARRGGVDVGLAIVCEGPSQRRFGRFGRALYVNQTGRSDVDRMTIEYNGFLLDRQGAPATAQAMWNCLGRTPAGRQEIHLRLGDLREVPALSPPPGMEPVLTARSTWVVDLRAVRAAGLDYVGGLSSNRRSAIRKALRDYAQLGPLQLSVAPDLATAQAYLQRLRALHARRWVGGNFSSPALAPFHEALLADAVPAGRAQLLRVQAGEHDVGYLYNFVDGARVLFYQSGFDYELLEGRGSPGLVTLALAIEHNARLGHDVADLLAGDVPYKADMATRSEALFTLSLQRAGLAWRLECTLRREARNLRTIAARFKGNLVGHALALVAAAMMPAALELPEVDDIIYERPRLVRLRPD